jgi:hypothetical protein
MDKVKQGIVHIEEERLEQTSHVRFKVGAIQQLA